MARSLCLGGDEDVLDLGCGGLMLNSAETLKEILNRSLSKRRLYDI